MKKQNFSCDECTAAWSLTHNMWDVYYTPKYCPFCGEQLPADDDIDEEEVEEESYEDDDE